MDLEAGLFFGRKPIIERIMQSLAGRKPDSFVLIGARMTGKSALLRHIHAVALSMKRGDADRQTAPVRIDCAAIESVEAFWAQLRNELLACSDGMVPHEGQEERLQKTTPPPSLELVAALLPPGRTPLFLLDNFDLLLLRIQQPGELCAQLHHLSTVSTLVLTAQRPLYDVQPAIAASPLVSNSAQLFLGLLEFEAARQWLVAHQSHTGVDDQLVDGLLSITGRHPYLLHTVGDCLAEVQASAPVCQGWAHLLPLIRLRLAEHGRPLFLAQATLLRTPSAAVTPHALGALIAQLQQGPVPAEQLHGEMPPALNWLINQALIAYRTGEHGLVYTLYSPLFAEFLALNAPQMAGAEAPAKLNTIPVVDAAFYDKLTKIEAGLLRYLQANSQRAVSTEQLLADVWKRPDASSRRVQEAIRRLRLQLTRQRPPVGDIKNERGRGYRFVPAQPMMRLSL
jgi:hypothetical protein